MPSNFDFVRARWPEIAEEARRAEQYTYGDPRSSVFYARRTLELAVTWLYKADSTLRMPYKDDLASLLHEPTFKQLVGVGILAKMNIIHFSRDPLIPPPVSRQRAAGCQCSLNCGPVSLFEK